MIALYLLPKTFMQEAIKDTLEDYQESSNRHNGLMSLLYQKDNIALLHELSLTFCKRDDLDVRFIDEGDPTFDKIGQSVHVRLANIKNLRVGSFSSGVFEEQVLDEAMCAGIYVPNVEKLEQEIAFEYPNLVGSPNEMRQEVKRRSYQKAEAIRRSLIPEFSADTESPTFFIGVALEGQLSLWKKLGFLKDVPSYREGAVTPKDLIDYLFYDAEGRKSGTLANLGIRFRTRGVAVPELDISFYTYDEYGTAHPCGIQILGHGKTDEKLEVYNNVVGLVCFPDDVPLFKRKLATRVMRGPATYWLKDPNFQLLSVTPKLLALWKQRGSPIPTEEEVIEAQQKSLKKQVDYGFTFGPYDQATLTAYENRQQIGGNKLFLSLHYAGGLKRTVGMDFGWAYEDDPALSKFPDRPSYELGISPYLDAEIIPKIRRFLGTDKLIKSLSLASLLAAAEDPSGSFIVSELYHRFGWDELERLICTEEPLFTDLSRLRDNLKVGEQQFYEQNKEIFDMMWLSHGHEDHWGVMFSIRDDIPFGLTPETALFLQAKFRTGWHYTNQEALIRKMREQPKVGNTFATYQRPLVYFYNGQSHRVSPDIEFTAHYVNHSIIGAAALGVRFLDPFGGTRMKLAYMGDITSGSLTDHAVEQLKDAHVVIMEGTNILPKPGIGITKERVGENLENLRKRADGMGGVYVVQIAQNNIERLQLVHEASGARTVCVTTSVAQILHEFAILNEWLPYDKKIDVPVLGRDVMIIKTKKGSYKPWEKQLMDTYGHVTVSDVVLHPEEYTMVIPPRKLLENMFSDLHKQVPGVFVRSNSWPFDPGERKGVVSNWEYCKRQEWEHYADLDIAGRTVYRPKNPMGLHYSGHATIDELLEYISTFAETGNLQLVYPLHVLRRGIYAERIQRYLMQKGIRSTFGTKEEVLRVVKEVGKGVFSLPLPLS